LSGLSASAVSTLDWWKLAALLAVFVDHYGHYLDPDENLWRAIGRSALPVFAFLIGYGGPRRPPLAWWLIGAALTFLDILASDDWSDVQINLLISFALMRLAMARIDVHVSVSALRLALLALGLALANPWVAPLIEYGSNAWLFMLVGLMHRRGQSMDMQAHIGTARLAAVFAAVVYMITEAQDYEFEEVDLWLMIALVAAVSTLFATMRRGTSALQPPQALVPAIRFLGRHTLEIYGLHLGLLMLGKYWFDIGG
jgi:hypothetical protein